MLHYDEYGNKDNPTILLLACRSGGENAPHKMARPFSRKVLEFYKRTGGLYGRLFKAHHSADL